MRGTVYNTVKWGRYGVFTIGILDEFGPQQHIIRQNSIGRSNCIALGGRRGHVRDRAAEPDVWQLEPVTRSDLGIACP